MSLNVSSPSPPPSIAGDCVETGDCVEAGNALVPDAASLGAQYKHWLENSIVQMFKDKYNQADARLNLAALGDAASQAIGSPCTNTYKISQGNLKSMSDIKLHGQILTRHA
jgi:hypothetical protein